MGPSKVRTRIYCTVEVAGRCSEGVESEADSCSERVMYNESFLSQRESPSPPVPSFWFGKTDADAEINEDCKFLAKVSTKKGLRDELFFSDPLISVKSSLLNPREHRLVRSQI